MNEYNRNLYPGSEHEKIKERPQTRNLFHLKLWAIISTAVAIVTTIALIGVLIRPASSASPTTSQPSTSQPSSKPSVGPSVVVGSTPASTQGVTPAATTPTQVSTVAAGTTLCQYDATHSFSDWNNSPQWKQVNNGILGSDGTDRETGSNNFITWSGCQLTTPNYAVEAQIQYVRSTNNGDPDTYKFGIMLRGDGKMSGYEVGVGKDNCTDRLAMISIVQDNQSRGSSICGTSLLLSPLPGAGSSHNYALDTGLHTFRAEITNNTIRLFIDQHMLLETTDNTFTAVGQVGLRDIYGDINIRSFIVTAL